MKTIIVPTDFSDTSKNAALYAVQLAAEVQNARIILYNVFEKSGSGSTGIVIDDQPLTHKRDMEMALESIKTDMLNTASPVDISCVAEESNSLLDSLERFAVDQKADLIIMGISGTTRFEQAFRGSNTLSMVDKNVCPVIIVPPHVHFKPIKNVMLASDFKDVEKTTPIKAIKAILDLFQSNVHVVNVDSEHFVELTDEYKIERAKLESILEGYQTDFYFMRQFDFVDAIGQFAADKNIDLILTVPRKHSFLSKLFVKSHTKKLVYHSDVPVLAIHE